MTQATQEDVISRIKDILVEHDLVGYIMFADESSNFSCLHLESSYTCAHTDGNHTKFDDKADRDELISTASLLGIISTTTRTKEKEMWGCFEQMSERWNISDEDIQTYIANQRELAILLGKHGVDE